MNNYRIAIVGLGGMGNHHAQAVQAEANCALVGGAEIDPQRGRLWQERFGAPVYADCEKMLDELAPDALIIATQAPMHHAPTLAAARRRIHVFCEKPIALDLVQADEMVAACDQHQVRFAINHIKRGSLYNRLALEWIARGEIGQLVRLRAFDKGGRRAGNSLMEMGTHLYDWMRLFAGDVEWTHAHLVQLDGRESTVHDIRHTQEVDPGDRDAGLVLGERCFATFRFRNGLHAEAEFLAQPRTDDRGYGIDLVGTEGRIAVRESVGTSLFIHRGQHHLLEEPWERVHLQAEDLDEEGRQRDRGSRRLLLQRLMLRDLMEAIEEGRDPFASGRDGRDCLEMIHATWESHRRRGRVYSPLTERQHPLERWRREEGGGSAA